MRTWPYLYAAVIPAWNVVIEGHRKVIDDKLRLVGLQDGDVLALDQTESALLAAIPTNSDDDTENFQVGMALDYCCSVSGYRSSSCWNVGMVLWHQHGRSEASLLMMPAHSSLSKRFLFASAW
jgi:hypothetical protein